MTTDGAVELETQTGARFAVRPALPTDDPALAEFFEHVSKDDLRFRFLSAITKVSPKQIEAMTHVDHRQTEDFMVFEPGSRRVVANAMLAADKSLQTAEVAITVDRDFKHIGLEQALLAHVTAVAKARGISKLQAIESRENVSAIEVERKAGFKPRGIEGDPMVVLLEASI